MYFPHISAQVSSSQATGRDSIFGDNLKKEKTTPTHQSTGTPATTLQQSKQKPTPNYTLNTTREHIVALMVTHTKTIIQMSTTYFHLMMHPIVK